MRQNGFTLIELIAVIVILGILAATAMPRFVNLRSAAIVSSMDGVVAAINSVSTMVYAKAIVEGLDGQPTTTMNIDGTVIDLAYGYPTGTANGIAKMINAGGWKERASTFRGAWVYWHGAINEDAGSAQCYIRYRQSTGVGNRPVIDIQRTGCPTAK